MANKKESSPGYALAIPGVVEAEVSLGYVEASFPGAHPTPFIKFLFVNAKGASVSVSSDIRQGAETLELLTLHHKMATPKIDGAWPAKGTERTSNLQSDPGQPTITFDGLRTVYPTIATMDKNGKFWPSSHADSSAAATWPAGEFPLTWIQLGEAGKGRRGKVTANLILDLWTAAALRDRLHQALTSAIPGPGPASADVTLIDGIVGTFPL